MPHIVLDISKYNEISNYASVSNYVDGIIIRCGYRGYGSTGTLATDSSFLTHYNGFVDYKPVGVYWFSQAISVAEAIEEANYCYNIIKDKRISFPIYLLSDYAVNTYTGRADNLTAAKRTEYNIAFLERIKELGYRAGIYASDTWFINNLDLSQLNRNGYSYWVTRIGENQPQYVEDFDAWHYTNDGGIPGTSYDVKLSNFYRDVAGWESTSGDAADISTTTRELEYDEAVYTGSEICPVLRIGTLALGRDYIVSYQNNINVGTATVTATAINGYTGTVVEHYTIKQKSIEGMQLMIPHEDYTYTGEPVEPVAYIYGLVRGDEYILSYENNINAGTGTVKADGIGNYTGHLSRNFNIATYDLSTRTVTLSGYLFQYTGEPIKPKLTIDGLVEGTDFIVSYLDNIQVSKEAKAIATGIGNYTGQAIKNFEINTLTVTDRTLTVNPTKFEYDGMEKRPVVTCGTLIEGQDFTVTFENNINAGTATATVHGIGNYAGEKSINFNITKKSIVDIPARLEETVYKYTGGPIKPKPIVDGLYESQDYTLSYLSNTARGTNCKCVITGTGNYKGSIKLDFEITYRDFADCDVTYGRPSRKTRYRIDNGEEEVTADGVKLYRHVDYMVVNEIREFRVDYIFITLVLKGLNNITGGGTYYFQVIDHEPEDGDYSDDGVYNFGDIDLGDETAQGIYDFLSTDYDNDSYFPDEMEEPPEDYDEDEEVSEGEDKVYWNVVKDEEDYDFEEMCGIYLADYGDPYRIDKDGNPVINGEIEKDDGVYNFGDIDIGDESAEGDYDFGDIDEGVDPNTVAHGDYDFNILAGDVEEGIEAGTEFVFEEIPIYANYCSHTSVGTRSGTYYIYDSTVKNGRIRITRTYDGVEKPVRSTAWVDVELLLSIGLIRVGDKIVVSGNIYKYANGTGSYIIKDSEIMYVVDILDEKQYEYPYAVASGPKNTRQGFASKDMLTKIKDYKYSYAIATGTDHLDDDEGSDYDNFFKNYEELLKEHPELDPRNSNVIVKLVPTSVPSFDPVTGEQITDGTTTVEPGDVNMGDVDNPGDTGSEGTEVPDTNADDYSII